MKITRDIGLVNETGSNLTVISYVVHICIHVQDELTIGIVIIVKIIGKVDGNTSVKDSRILGLRNPSILL